jgi:hypothetical protein
MRRGELSPFHQSLLARLAHNTQLDAHAEQQREYQRALAAHQATQEQQRLQLEQLSQQAQDAKASQPEQQKTKQEPQLLQGQHAQQTYQEQQNPQAQQPMQQQAQPQAPCLDPPSAALLHPPHLSSVSIVGPDLDQQFPIPTANGMNGTHAPPDTGSVVHEGPGQEATGQGTPGHGATVQQTLGTDAGQPPPPHPQKDNSDQKTLSAQPSQLHPSQPQSSQPQPPSQPAGAGHVSPPGEAEAQDGAPRRATRLYALNEQANSENAKQLALISGKVCQGGGENTGGGDLAALNVQVNSENAKQLALIAGKVC